MARFLAGVASALLLAAAGVFFFTSGARTGNEMLPAPPLRQAAVTPVPLPAKVPEATERTREQKRFDRYDKDRDGRITRDEYMLHRRKSYAKLDRDHDGKLSFAEWNVAIDKKFDTADGDHSNAMDAAEFLTTKVKHKARPACSCGGD